MDCNQDSVEMFNQMVALGSCYGSGRPVMLEPSIAVGDIRSKIPLTRNDILLDVGCGTGFLTIPIAKECKFVYALDAGRDVIEAARREAREQHIQNIVYYLGSALDLPFEANFFDHVLMYGVIHYMENNSQVTRCISELVRVCKIGGRILIADIPDQHAKLEFEQRMKTDEEMRILRNFNDSRTEYDLLFMKHIRKMPERSSAVFDCEKMVEYGKGIGCDGAVHRQDIRLPFSFTRRDVLLTKRRNLERDSV